MSACVVALVRAGILACMDLVCAQCGSELVYVEFNGAHVPKRCSNDRCPNSDDDADFVWTAKRADWQPDLVD